MAAIIVDTREKHPWAFECAIRRRLALGDYSVDGLESLVAVERKSLADLVSTLMHAWPRFKRELQGLASMPFAALVIEASPIDIEAHRYASKAPQAAIRARLLQVPIPIIWGGDRAHARLQAEAFLRDAERRLGEQHGGHESR